MFPAIQPQLRIANQFPITVPHGDQGGEARFCQGQGRRGGSAHCAGTRLPTCRNQRFQVRVYMQHARVR